MRRLIGRLSPARRNAISRGGRYFAYQMIGVILANAAAIAATALIHFHSSPEVVTAGGWFAASVAAGAKRAYSYVETGAPTADPIPTLPAPVPGGTP